MNKTVTVSILGAGQRGANTYGRIMSAMPDKFKIVALCDFDREKLNKYKNQFGVSDENVFDNDDKFISGWLM